MSEKIFSCHIFLLSIFGISILTTKKFLMDDLHGNLNVSNGMIIKDADNTEYQITKLLGKGTFGQVFEVVNLTNKQVLALKVAKSLQAYKNQALSELRMHDIVCI